MTYDEFGKVLDSFAFLEDSIQQGKHLDDSQLWQTMREVTRLIQIILDASETKKS